MTLSVLQSLTAGSAGSGTTMTQQFASPVVQHSTLICFVMNLFGTSSAGVTVSDDVNGSWGSPVLSGAVTNDGDSVILFRKVNTGSGQPTVSVTMPGSNNHLFTIAELGGCDTTESFDQSDSTGYNAGSTTPLSGDITPSQANAIIVAAYGASGNEPSPTITSPSGAAVLGGDSPVPSATFMNALSKIVSASGAQHAGWTFNNGSQEWRVIIASFIGPAVTSPTIDPGVGALALTGFAPVVTQQITIKPAAGSLGLTGFAPVVAPAQNLIKPTAGTLALTGFAPTVSQQGILKPAAAALALTGQTPSVTQQFLRNPVAGALALQGFAPTVTKSGNPTINPAAGTLALTGQVSPQTLTVPAPSAAALGLTGSAPKVIQGINRIPAAGSLSFQGFAPVITVNSPGSSVIRPNTGSLALTGLTPVITQGFLIKPPAGALALTGVAPNLTLNTNTVIKPATASLALTGAAPTLKQNLNRGPAAASLAFQGFAPNVQVTLAGQRNPLAGSLTFQGYPPNVRVPVIINPPAGSLVLSGQLSTGGGTGTGSEGAVVEPRSTRRPLQSPIRYPVRVFHNARNQIFKH